MPIGSDQRIVPGFKYLHMTLIIVLLVAVAVVQAGIFYYSRKLKREMRENDVLLKYGIESRSDLFAALGNQNIPEDDRKKLEAIYQGNEE